MADIKSKCFNFWSQFLKTIVAIAPNLNPEHPDLESQ